MAARMSALASGDYFATLRRFPLASLCALALAVCFWHLFDPAQIAAPATFPIPPHIPTRSEAGRILLGRFLLSAFFWTFAAALFGESRSRKAGLLAAFAGLAALAFAHDVYLASQYVIFNPAEPLAAASRLPAAGGLDAISLIYLDGCIVFLPFLAPYTRGLDQSGAFWQFAHRLTVAYLGGIIGAALAYGSVYASFATIRLLFHPEAPDSLGILFDMVQRIVFAKAGVVAVFGVAPAIWLSLTPQAFQEPPPQGKEKEFTSKAVALLVKFILIPAGSILSLILGVYIVKVIADGSFETARLGYRGLLYASGIVLLALMAYPEREGPRVVRIFWRAWPWLLLPPTLLALVAIEVRIREYGWSQSRYLACLAGIWLAAVTAASMSRRLRGDLRFVPGLLAAFLLLASFGPWGATVTIGRSQAGRLIALFESKGFIDNGAWIAKSAPAAWTPDERREIESGLRELEATRQLWRLKPLFQNDSDNPFAGEATAVARAIRARVGVPDSYNPVLTAKHAPSPFVAPKHAIGQYGVRSPHTIDAGDVYVIGPQFFAKAAKSSVLLPFGRIDFLQKDLVLEVSVLFLDTNTAKTRRFDLAQFRDAVFGKNAVSDKQVTDSESRTIEGEGDADVTLKIAHLETPLDGAAEPTNGSYYAIVPRPKP